MISNSLRVQSDCTNRWEYGPHHPQAEPAGFKLHGDTWVWNAANHFLTFEGQTHILHGIMNLKESHFDEILDAVKRTHIRESVDARAKSKVNRKLKPKQLVDFSTLAEQIFVTNYDLQQMTEEKTGLKDNKLDSEVNLVWNGMNTYSSCYDLVL